MVHSGRREFQRVNQLQANMSSAAPITLFFVAAHALIRRGDEYLIVRRSTQAGYGAHRWEVPGGIVEAGETVEEALIREILEETGLTVDIIRLMRAYTNRDSLPSSQHFEITYLCSYRSGETRLNPAEHDSHRWLNLDDLKRLDFAARDFLVDLLSTLDPGSLAFSHEGVTIFMSDGTGYFDILEGYT